MSKTRMPNAICIGEKTVKKNKYGPFGMTNGFDLVTEKFMLHPLNHSIDFWIKLHEWTGRVIVYMEERNDKTN